MAWINRIECNMDISRTVYEGEFDNCLVTTAQKIAIYAVVPLALIAIFEAVVKNMILINLTNFVITLLNTGYTLITGDT